MTMGDSGGGGEPRVALVVEVEAVESIRPILFGSRMLSLAKAACAALPTVGAGNESGLGKVVCVEGALCGI